MVNLAPVYAALDRFLEEKMQQANIPGMVVALTDREHLLRVSTYGLADIATRSPVTPETLFEIGSISKSFTSMLLLQLQAEGRLDLHAPVTRYLPWFQVQSTYEPITVHHLLSHTAGITSGVDFAPSSRYSTWALRETTAASAPGTHYHYSNVGYQALGYLLEELLHQPYGQILQERLLTPLGMHATEPVFTHETRKRLAIGYEYFYDDRPNLATSALVPATWLECGAGDGSIAATAADLAIYLRLLLNKGQGSHFLSEANYHLMTQRLVQMEEGVFYGYGLFTSERDSATVIGHTGGMVGYNSVLLADPEHGLGTVVFVNGPANPFGIANFALKLLRAASLGERLPEPPVLATALPAERVADYTGTYHGGDNDKTLVVTHEKGQLMLAYQGERIPLAKLNASPDVFYTAHPDFALYSLRFVREKGKIVELYHGSDWYVSEHATTSTTLTSPPHWETYVGHYRSYNPWLSNFRIVLRKGSLVFLYPSGEEKKLTVLDNASDSFRIGEEEYEPECIHFDTVVNQRALRASIAGGDYFRTFTP
ncbi:serine hydrolase domain-containing protein [Ktedonobacter racemifer]|uniref:Beta-lactamase n=1 Tax=Ktedonobacter racemifer DSM 44963 TaxID=485913 RepID=D6U6J8_KTERA|nr:serine hydrolase domain-containing protein [Ktedonobacter racemifer]EFH80609.1 beta-lactamase [Ktedonobacter racemifer DSM 44963]